MIASFSVNKLLPIANPFHWQFPTEWRSEFHHEKLLELQLMSFAAPNNAPYRSCLKPQTSFLFEHNVGASGSSSGAFDYCENCDYWFSVQNGQTLDCLLAYKSQLSEIYPTENPHLIYIKVIHILWKKLNWFLSLTN